MHKLTRNNIVIIIFYLSCFSFIEISAKNLEATSVVHTDVASIIQSQNDSILKLEFDSINKLYKKKKYVLSLEKAFKFYEKSKFLENRYYEQKSSLLIGDIFKKTNDHKKSAAYYKKSLDVLNRTGFFETKDERLTDVTRARTLLRIGSAYQSQRKNDSAIYFYRELDKFNSLNDKILNYQAGAYSNLSGIYMKDSIFDISREYAKRAIEIHRTRGNNLDIAGAISNLSSTYLMQEDYEKAKELYYEAIDLIEHDESGNAISYKASFYANLAYCLYKLEDHEAYVYQRDSYGIKDELRSAEVQRMIAQVNRIHNIDLVKQSAELKESKRQQAVRNTWIIGISSLFVIVILVFVLKQYKLRQKNLGLELSRQELMQQQKLEKIKAESQIRILNATLDGKESERKQIAETLHDSVSALLSSANLHLQACKTQFNGSTPIEVDKSQTIINEASQKIRDLSHTLVSSILLKFGLSFAIKDIAEKFSNSELKIDYDTRYIQRYDQGFEIKLYNIIQEFINNILKHSHASHARITLVEKKKKLHLIIEDNGQGFDKAQIPEKDGLGINQIDARIQMMKGKFNIDTAKGKGTKIVIELPVFEKEPISIS